MASPLVICGCKDWPGHISPWFPEQKWLRLRPSRCGRAGFLLNSQKSAVALEKTESSRTQVQGHNATLACFPLSLLLRCQMCVLLHRSRPSGPKTHLCIIRTRCKVKPQQTRGKTRFVMRFFFHMQAMLFCNLCVCVFFFFMFAQRQCYSECVCGPASASSTPRRKPNAALSGPSLRTICHSITSNAA